MAQIVKILKVFRHSEYAVVEWRDEYVACWLPKVKSEWMMDWDFPGLIHEGMEVNCYWSQGHYFGNRREAFEFAVQKEEDAVQAEIEWLQDRETCLKDEVKSIKEDVEEYLKSAYEEMEG